MTTYRLQIGFLAKTDRNSLGDLRDFLFVFHFFGSVGVFLRLTLAFRFVVFCVILASLACLLFVLFPCVLFVFVGHVLLF